MLFLLSTYKLTIKCDLVSIAFQKMKLHHSKYREPFCLFYYYFKEMSLTSDFYLEYMGKHSGAVRSVLFSTAAHTYC